MSGTNAGTGQPLAFRCAKCRIERPYRPGASGIRWGPSSGINVKLTGRTRPKGRVSALGPRMDRIAREYRCLDCGHVGWSHHYDLVRIAG